MGSASRSKPRKQYDHRPSNRQCDAHDHQPEIDFQVRHGVGGSADWVRQASIERGEPLPDKEDNRESNDQEDGPGPDSDIASQLSPSLKEGERAR